MLSSNVSNGCESHVLVSWHVQASLGFGGMVTAFMAPVLYELFDARICFMMSAIIPGGRMYLAWRLKEPPAGKFDPKVIQNQVRKMVKDRRMLRWSPGCVQLLHQA